MKKISFIVLFLSFFIYCSPLQAQRKGINQTLSEHYFYNEKGDSSSLATIFGQYKDSLVYVDLWASWCKPCLEELPYSAELAEKLAGRPVVFLYLSMDESSEAWQKAVQKQPFPISARHYRRGLGAAQPLLAQLFIYSIPHYLVLDKAGKILNRDATPPSQKSTLKYLNKLLKAK